MKKPVGKTKEELALEKKRELEKRLQDVSGQLNSAKKPPKKGEGRGGVGEHGACTGGRRTLSLGWQGESVLLSLGPCWGARCCHRGGAGARAVLSPLSPRPQAFNAAACPLAASEKPESAQQVAVSRLSASSSSSDSSSSSSSSSSSDTSDSDSG